MVEYISDLRLFLTISRTLNFREAGERLGYSPAVVTTRMQRLEAMTGKTLLIRTTRQIRLTEEGENLVQIAEQIVDMTEQISRPIHGQPVEMTYKGTVRITSPHSFARLFLLEPIMNIMNAHPELIIDLVLEDSISRLVQEEIDISFRVGGEPAQNTQAYDLFIDKRILVASPNYLSRHSTIKCPDDLRQHTCLTYSHSKAWQLVDANGTRSKVELVSLLQCNTGDYLRQLALRGAGIIAKSEWSLLKELDEGSLVRVLPDHLVGELQRVRALLPKRDYVPARVSYVLDEITKHIRDNIPYEFKLDAI